MRKPFLIQPLHDDDLTRLWQLSKTELATQNAQRIEVGSKPSYPCRISLEDAEIGETVIGVPYTFNKSKSFYQASGPIFMRQNVSPYRSKRGHVPTMLLSRLLSLRSYCVDGYLQTAEVIPGNKLADYLAEPERFSTTHYVHIHNARTGCYLCQAVHAD